MVYRTPAKPDPSPRPKKVRLTLPSFHATMLSMQIVMLVGAMVAYYLLGALARGTGILLAIGVQVALSWFYWKRAVAQAERDAELRRQVEREREERQRWFDEHR